MPVAATISLKELKTEMEETSGGPKEEGQSPMQPQMPKFAAQSLEDPYDRWCYQHFLQQFVWDGSASLDQKVDRWSGHVRESARKAFAPAPMAKRKQWISDEAWEAITVANDLRKKMRRANVEVGGRHCHLLFLWLGQSGGGRQAESPTRTPSTSWTVGARKSISTIFNIFAQQGSSAPQRRPAGQHQHRWQVWQQSASSPHSVPRGGTDILGNRRAPLHC